MGAGRSGSTVLGITLGNCSDFIFTGELARWHRRAGMPLGASGERERFWRSVREQVDGGEDALGPEVRSLQQSSGAFCLTDWPAQRRLRPGYRRASEELLTTIARTAGVSHVVDTSHFPRRARELQALEGIELYLLFLVRDPQSVVASYTRRNVVQGPRFGTLATNAYLWLTHLLSVPVFLRHPRKRRLFVRHEDFLADPRSVLREILEMVGARSEIPDLTALRADYAFLGNRLLTTPVIALRAQPERSSRRSPLTTLLQAPWRPVLARLGPVAGGSMPRAAS